ARHRLAFRLRRHGAGFFAVGIGLDQDHEPHGVLLVHRAHPPGRRTGGAGIDIAAWKTSTDRAVSLGTRRSRTATETAMRLALATSFLVLAACTPAGPPKATQPEAPQPAVAAAFDAARLPGYHWVLGEATAVDGARLDALFPVPGKPLQLDF